MNLQFIQDSTGNPTGVYVPINDWKHLKMQYRKLEDLEEVEPSKKQLLTEIKQSVLELKLIEQGKLKARPIKNLLNDPQK